MARVLIFGGRGLLGSWWQKQRACVDEIYIAVSSQPKTSQEILVNKKSIESIEKAIIASKADLIVNCVAHTDVNRCKSEADICRHLNVEFARILGRATSRARATMIHISTDMLYNDDCYNGAKSEKDPTHPLNLYAETKLLGESAVLEENINSLILRTNFIGASVCRKSSYTDWLLKNLREQKRLLVNSDVYFNPVHYSELIESAHLLYSMNARGIFNISASNYINKFEFAQLLGEKFKVSTSGLVATSQSLKQEVARPANMVLSNLKAAVLLGKSFYTVEEYLDLVRLETPGIQINKPLTE